MKKYAPDLLVVPKQNFAIEKRCYIDSTQDKSFPHIHEFYEILFVYQGKRIINVENKISELNLYNIAFIPPYKYHITKSAQDKNCKRLLINFTYDFIKDTDNAFLENLLICFNTENNIVTFSEETIELIYGIFEEILYEYNTHTDKLSNHIIKTLLFRMLLTASRVVLNNTALNPPQISPNYYTILEIAGYLTLNYKEKITLDMLEEKFHLSKFVISREFKYVFGISFVDYTNNVRIKHAEKLLASKTEKNITTAAYECGFDSLSHFTRVFKKITGVNPLHYKKYSDI